MSGSSNSFRGIDMHILHCIVTLWITCQSNAAPAAKVAAVGPTAVVSTCTFTKDARNNITLGASCTAADVFVNAGAANFHLVGNSPAINNATCVSFVPTDFDGKPRPTPGAKACDIGAYQYGAAKPPPEPPKNLRHVTTAQ
jgi:hypothetical protein